MVNTSDVAFSNETIVEELKVLNYCCDIYMESTTTVKQDEAVDRHKDLIGS